jgi:serine phosphatase RsbU (regulator of sigma subunit)
LKDTLNQVYVLNGIETSYFKRYNDEPSHKEFLEKSIEYNLKARNLILEKPIYRTVLLQSDISLAGLLIERNLYDSVYKIIKRIEHVPIKSENIKRLLISLKLNYFYKIKKYDSCYNIIRYHTNLLNKSSNEDKLEYLKVKFNVLKNLNKFKDAMNVCDTIIFTYPLYYNELILSKTEDFEYNQKITKKELSIRLLNEKNKIEILKNKQKNILIILTLFAFILSLAFLILTLKNKKKIQELNKGLALQKLLLEEKNHEITQSINYASRIQQALLKQNIPPSLISSIHDSFILYLPKDIVSGDFYWIFKTEKLNEYIGVFDCTGHGVPGSFVSLMNLNLLIESVKVANKIFPDEILNYVREKIILLLNLDEYQKDGMDGSLLFFPENFSSTRIAFYAAANNPLFLISDRQVFVSEYDKMPVGKSEHKIPFKKHEIKITSGTKIFLSTDGFKDQFGGNMNKRLGSKKFRELLTEISELPLIEQKTFLLDFFNKWKNQNEQTDDICIMGIEC